MTMPDTQRPHRLQDCSDCWIARGIGLLVNSFFLFVLFQTLTDANGVPLPLWPMVACMTLCVLGVFVALRWEQAGGRITIAGAVAMVPANLLASVSTNLGWYGLVPALVYSVPFFLVGSLFVSGRRTGRR
jgi:hypothetical protein